MKNIKKFHESMIIPEELNRTVNYAIHEKKNSYLWKMITVSLVTSFLFMIVILPNSSYVFAKELYKIPVIGQMARFFTFGKYHEESEYKYVDVKMPILQNTGNSALEQRINHELLLKISKIIDNVEQEAEAYKKALIETGGKESDFQPFHLTVDYEIKYTDDQTLSFVITSVVGNYTAFVEQFFYNIDLKTGNDIHLTDLLGNNYQEKISKQIKDEMKKRVEEDDNLFYFDGKDAFSSVRGDEKFFINEKRQVVISFPKYAVAPGYMGIQEFVVK